MDTEALKTFTRTRGLFRPWHYEEDTTYYEKIKDVPDTGVTTQEATTTPPSDDSKPRVFKEMLPGRGVYLARMEAERLERLKKKETTSSSVESKRDSASPEQDPQPVRDPKYVYREMVPGRAAHCAREEAERLRHLEDEEQQRRPQRQQQEQEQEEEEEKKEKKEEERKSKAKEQSRRTMLVTVYYRYFFRGKLQRSESSLVLLRNPKYHRLSAKLQRTWRRHFPGHLDAPTLRCGLNLNEPAQDGEEWFDRMWKLYMSRGKPCGGKRPHLRLDGREW